MITKILFTVALMTTLSQTASAVERKDFLIPKGSQADLIKETQSLKLDKEKAVQEANPPAKLYITVLGGVTQPTSLSVESHGHTVSYNFAQQLPLATVQFNRILFNAKGQWGLLGSLGYSYSQYNHDSVLTALHVVPVNLSLVYRGDWSFTQKFIPFLGAGPGSFVYFQRGLDEYNTSQALWMGTATAGLAINLNRLGWLNSRNDTEIVLQFQRNISASGGPTDLNGNTIQLGGTIAL